MSYDKSEVDVLVGNLNSRIDASNVTLNTVNSAVAAHNISPDAHNTIFVTKALKTTVSDLSDTVNALKLRIENLEDVSPLKGTIDYSLVGTAGETSVSITFDIEPIDENNPVTYEVYGDGSLITGLTFDPSAGTITGTPTVGGTATYVVLAKSGSYGAFITISQNFEGGNYSPVISVTPVSPVTATSGTAISDIQISYSVTNAEDGVEATLTASGLPDGLTLDATTGVISGTPTTTGTFSSIITIEYPGADTITTTVEFTINEVISDAEQTFNTIMQLLEAGDTDALTDWLGVPILVPLNDHDGVTRNYRVMMTSYDTDGTPGYPHNARFEFLDIVGTRAYDADKDNKYQTSDIRAYLTSENADGFMVRLPSWLKDMIVPTNIVSISSSSTTSTLTDKVFLPSAWELCGTVFDNYWYKEEGKQSLYYPKSYGSEDKRIRYNLDGVAVDWWTRSLHRSNSYYAIDVRKAGNIPMTTSIVTDSVGVAPAFVIAAGSEDPDEPVVYPGVAELTNIVTKLRTGELSGLTEGMEITIQMADETEDADRRLTYNDLDYIRYPADDIDTLYAWANVDNRIYTDEIAIVAGAAVKDVSGNIIGTLATTPSYMKDYRIMLTSIDTDEPTAGTYPHNARFEFLDIVGTRAYDAVGGTLYPTSDIRSYLTSENADGFMVRLPADIRRFIVPNNIECIADVSGSIVDKETLSDKVFLLSAWELGADNSVEGYSDYQEGTEGTYYTTSGVGPHRYNFDSTYIQDPWWTRTPNPAFKQCKLCMVVGIINRASTYYTSESHAVAPAFVIA